MLARAGLLSALTLALGTAPLAAQQAAPAPSTVRFEVSGNSTIRGWTCTVDGTVSATPASGAAAVAGFPNGVQGITVTVPVREFECPEEAMTEHLMDAMKPDQHREISFVLQRYALTGNGARARATGNITIGGVTKPLTVSGTIAPAGQGFRFVGEAPLDMTEFGIEPPVVMMGMMKVRPAIRVKFDAVVAPTS